jgi:hypothetical protein
MVKKPKPYKVRIQSRGVDYEKVMRETLKDAESHVMEIDEIKLQTKKSYTS